MKVSVIIPCYNGEKFIERAVKNVINQTYKNIEIIIVDDLSTDNSVSIIKKMQKKYPKIVKPYFSKTNNGPGGAKNEGIKLVTGDYFTVMDCDDYFDDNYIELMIKEVIDDPKLDIVLTGFKKVDENGNIAYKRTYKNSEKVLWQVISIWGRLYKTSWFKKNKFELPYGRILDDILFQVPIILSKPKFKYIDITGYNYVYNKESISHTTFCEFIKDSIEKEQAYLLEQKKYVKNADEEKILEYFAFRTMCWHLLKSGCKVGKEAMKNEYTKAFNYLEKEFPNFKKNIYVSLFKKTNDRTIIKFAMIFIKNLYKLHLSSIFFNIYSKVNFQRLWPQM